MSICLSVWLPAWLGDTHKRKHTPRYQSSPTPASVFSFSFGSRSLPSHSLCLQIQTNQSSFDLLETSLAGERHFECDESVEGEGGLSEDASGRAVRWRLLPAEKVAIEQPRSLRVASGGELPFSCFFSLQPPQKTAFFSHDLYPVVSTQDHIKPTCEISCRFLNIYERVWKSLIESEQLTGWLSRLSVAAPSKHLNEVSGGCCCLHLLPDDRCVRVPSPNWALNYRQPEVLKLLRYSYWRRNKGHAFDFLIGKRYFGTK